MNLYQRIKELADRKNMTIAELERRAGISNGQIRRWVKSSPKLENVARVAKILDVSIDYLQSGKDSNDSESAVDLKDDDVFMTYGGRPVTKEELEMMKRIARGGDDD